MMRRRLPRWGVLALAAWLSMLGWPASSARSAGGDATADAVLGQSDFASSASGLSASSLNLPSAVAVDSGGRLWVADTDNNRVLSWPNAAAFSNGLAADFAIGQNGSFTSGACNLGGTSAGSLCGPNGVAVDGQGNLYVSDRDNHRVLQYDDPAATNSPIADRVFGQGGSFTDADCNRGGVSDNSLCSPFGVAVDGPGNLYVADRDNHRVLLYRSPSENSPIADRVFGQGGSFASNGCNQGGISARSLCLPFGVDLDGTGNLYVADRNNNRVLVYSSPLESDATADVVLGQGGSFSSDGCSQGGISARNLCLPIGVAVDDSGRLYVSDRNNSRLLVYNGPLASDPVANLVFGQGGRFDSGECNQGGRSASSLCLPFGVAVDSARNIYISDVSNHRVLRFDTPIP